MSVTSSGHVHCVDTSNHQTLWSRSIRDLDDDSDTDSSAAATTTSPYPIAEVSALINPHPMRINDTGVVVVAVRRSVLASSDVGSEAPGAQSASSHFSYYAFNGRSGALRWRHASSDFLSPGSSSVSSASVMHEQHSVHTGEVEWRNYRHDVIAAMPHSWFSPADTRLSLAQLTPPNRAGQGSSTKQAADKASSSARAASRATQMLPSALSVHIAAQQAHDDSEHITHPTAIVAHTRDGIEVLALYTGRPITHLPLDAAQTHADINADGVIDHLTVVHPPAHTASTTADMDDATLPLSSASWQSQLSPCTALVSSHIPPAAQLFNVSVCSSPVDQLLAIHFMQAAAGLRRSRRPGGRYSPPPAFLGRRHMRVGAAGNGRRGSLATNSSAASDDSGAAGDSASEREMVGDSDEWQQQQADSWSSKQSAAVPLLLPDTRIVSGGGGQPLVALFLSSAGLLTAVDACGSKLFATHTAAQFAVEESNSGKQLVRRVVQYDVKQDGSMVTTQPISTISVSQQRLSPRHTSDPPDITSATSADGVSFFLPLSLPDVCRSRVCSLWATRLCPQCVAMTAA